LPGQGFLNGTQPTRRLLIQRVAPTLHRAQGGCPTLATSRFDLAPGLLPFKAGAEGFLDALYQIMPVCQQKVRQAGTGVPTCPALPALDPYPVTSLMVLWLTPIVPMSNQSMGCSALRTTLWAWAIVLLFLVAVLLWIRSKIGYNGGGLSGSGSCSRGDGFLAGRPFSVGLDPNHTGLFGRERPLSLERPAVYLRVAVLFISDGLA
jgi:hypothetical protein